MSPTPENLQESETPFAVQIWREGSLSLEHSIMDACIHDAVSLLTFHPVDIMAVFPNTVWLSILQGFLSIKLALKAIYVAVTFNKPE